MTGMKREISTLFYKYLNENNVTASFNAYEFRYAFDLFIKQSHSSDHIFNDYNIMDTKEYAQNMNITLNPDNQRSNNTYYYDLYNSNSQGTLGFLCLFSNYALIFIVFLFMMYKIIRCYRLRRRNNEDANNDVENKSSNEYAYNLIEEKDADEDADNPSEEKGADEDADNPSEEKGADEDGDNP